MKAEQLDNKKIAFICWGETEAGDDDVTVFTGIGRWNGTSLSVERKEGTGTMPFEEEWLERVKEVPLKLKEALLHADYSISLSVGRISDEEVSEGYIAMGLKWPKSEKDE